MRYRTLIVKRLPATAMALYPFMLFKNQWASTHKVIIRHELIHFQQQLELLILPFYLIYFVNYLLNLIVYLNHGRAYKNIVFEREAYGNDHRPDYLERRKPFAWISYFPTGR